MEIPFVDLNTQYKSIQQEIDVAIKSVITDTAFIGGKFVAESGGGLSVITACPDLMLNDTVIAAPGEKSTLPGLEIVKLHWPKALVLTRPLALTVQLLAEGWLENCGAKPESKFALI